ncbi:MAG: YbhB/YbcL family Raf kinase inhibitor-like protein [Fibrobacter sp.]|nr:YbhB/YbcL family Raf kinase inhibitor-like protein [Fibrobacter sp.]
MGISKVSMNKHSINVSSNSFKNGDNIPMEYTCDSENISPHISWCGIPKETESIVIVAYDKDIPFRGLSFFTWIHWVVYNIPPEVTELNENLPKDAKLIKGIRQGITTFKTSGYGGPCPPFGKHRYFFRIMAIDKKLNLPRQKNLWVHSGNGRFPSL